MDPVALSLRFLQAQPDARLVALARQGSDPAFEVLVRRYRQELLSYCRRLQSTAGGAEDALQQTFLQAWRALNSGAEVRNVRPWLYQIAHNVTLNQLRAPIAVPQEIPEAIGSEGVDLLVERRLLARAALAGVAALPAVQRQAFVSTTIAGASHEEVAKALGLSGGAVRGLIYRARANLRAAVAAVTPMPALNWIIRRAETRASGASGIAEAAAGGGGAGVVAVLAKGGAVLTLAGVVAGGGGVGLIHGSGHGAHRNAQASRVSSVGPGADNLGLARLKVGIAPPAGDVNRDVAEVTVEARGPSGSRGGSSRGDGRRSQGGSQERFSGRDGGSGTSDGDSGSGTPVTGSGKDSSGGSDGGTSGGSDGGTSGGSDGGTATSGTGTSGGSGGSDGGSATSTSGQSSGTSDGGSGTSGGAQTTPTTSDGGSGPDGGSSGTSGSSGSGDTTTTSGSH